MFAITRFRYIKVQFHIFCITGAKNIVRYTKDFVRVVLSRFHGSDFTVQTKLRCFSQNPVFFSACFAHSRRV